MGEVVCLRAMKSPCIVPVSGWDAVGGGERSQAASFHFDDLVSIPNRITSSGKSKSTCIFTQQQGRKGVNQDAMIVWEIWDVLSNEQVVEVVATASSRASAASLVVDSAAREWKLKYPTSTMDDCAVVCLFLVGKMDSDYEEQRSSSATNAVESDESQSAEPCLQRNVTVRSSSVENNSCGNVNAETDDAEKEKATEGERNWSGLEGVTRVNSLVQLPRFSGDELKT